MKSKERKERKTRKTWDCLDHYQGLSSPLTQLKYDCNKMAEGEKAETGMVKIWLEVIEGTEAVLSGK